MDAGTTGLQHRWGLPQGYSRHQAIQLRIQHARKSNIFDNMARLNTNTEPRTPSASRHQRSPSSGAWGVYTDSTQSQAIPSPPESEQSTYETPTPATRHPDRMPPKSRLPTIGEISEEVQEGGTTVRRLTQNWRNSLVHNVAVQNFDGVVDNVQEAFERGRQVERERITDPGSYDDEALNLAFQEGKQWQRDHPTTETPQSSQRPDAGMEALLTTMRQGLMAFAPPPEGRDVKPFNGDPKKFKSWLTSIKREFRLAPSYFANDEVKITWAMRKFGEKMEAYTDALENSDKPGLLTDWSVFESYLSTTYDRKGLKLDKIKKLNTLMQTTSVEDFSSPWEELLLNLKLSLEDNKLLFVSKLKDRVIDTLHASEFDVIQASYQDIKLKAIAIDDATFSREQKQAAATKATISGNTTPQPTAMRGGASFRGRGGGGTGSATERSKLSEEERKYRKENKLCMYCGKHKDSERCPEPGYRFTPSSSSSSPAPTTRQSQQMDSYRPDYQQGRSRRDDDDRRNNQRDNRRQDDRRGARQGATQLLPQDADSSEEDDSDSQ